MAELTEVELVERAKNEPVAVLRLWLFDGRRWVQRVAKRELAARAASGEGEA